VSQLPLQCVRQRLLRTGGDVPTVNGWYDGEEMSLRMRSVNGPCARRAARSARPLTRKSRVVTIAKPWEPGPRLTIFCGPVRGETGGLSSWRNETASPCNLSLSARASPHRHTS
jgi:hypothetical protein